MDFKRSFYQSQGMCQIWCFWKNLNSWLLPITLSLGSI